MTSNDQKTHQLCQEALNGRLSIKELSILINKSYRQTQRILKNVHSHGMLAIKHGNFLKTPHNKTNLEIELDIKNLLKSGYYDFNLTHFKEMLIEKEGIDIGKNVIHRIAKLNGLVKNPKRRSASKIHKPRARMPSIGMLIQFDGSVHCWFNEITCDLIGGMDDANGKILALEFFHGETSLHCMKVMKEITINYGVPSVYYLDGAGYFGKVDRDVETQIGRALEQLGSKALIAGSSQAKGKIERLWLTLQDRLVAELRYYEIKTIEEANLFLKNEFIPKFNQRFSVTPREKNSYFKTVENQNLDLIFCRKEQRKISMSNSFSYNGDLCIIDEHTNYKFRRININTHIDGKKSYDISGRNVAIKKAAENIIELPTKKLSVA